MKKPYECGVIKRVKLVPEEAVLISCKSPNVRGPQFVCDEPLPRCADFGS